MDPLTPNREPDLDPLIDSTQALAEVLQADQMVVLESTTYPGMGGHCLPVDPFYLSWRAREFDMTTEFIKLAGKINQQMPYHCVAKVQRVGPPRRGQCKPPRPARAQRRRTSRQGLTHRAARRQLQARRRRHPRVPRPEDPHAALHARRGVALPRPSRPHAPRPRPLKHPLGGGLARRRPRRDRHRPPHRRPRHGAHARTACRGPARRHTRSTG